VLLGAAWLVLTLGAETLIGMKFGRPASAVIATLSWSAIAGGNWVALSYVFVAFCAADFYVAAATLALGVSTHIITPAPATRTLSLFAYTHHKPENHGRLRIPLARTTRLLPATIAVALIPNAKFLLCHNFGSRRNFHRHNFRRGTLAAYLHRHTSVTQKFQTLARFHRYEATIA
jgi:hypothetical protein